MEYLNRKAPEQAELEKNMVQGPDPDEEERKEKTESVKAEDDGTGPPLCVTRPQTELVMEGKPFSAEDDFDNDVAGQRRSETKRMESLAGVDQTELVMDGKPFSAEDEFDNDVAGQRESVTKRIESWAGGDQTELVMDGKPFSVEDEFDNDVAGQRGSATKRIESLAGGDQTELGMEGKPFTAEDEFNIDVAGHRGSETKRIESWAGGDQTELGIVEGKLFSAADEFDNDVAGQHGSATKRKESWAGGDQTDLGMDGKPFSAVEEFDYDVAGQRRSETKRMESSGWGDGPCSPNTELSAASWMGREWPTANHEGDCDLTHQQRTRESESRKSAPEYFCNMFGTRSAVAVWIMMALTVATSSLAGAECIGTEVKLDKGEAVLRCRLPVSVSDTGQGIIIKHFPETGSDPDMVMYCFGPTKEADKPECYSSDGFSLVGQLTDQVVVKVPVSRLKDSGDYKVQHGDHKDCLYFSACRIHRFSDNDEDQRSAVTPTIPVVSSTATDSSTLGQDPPDRESPPCGRQSDPVEMTGAILGLQIIIILLLVVNVLIIRRQNN